MKTSIYVAALSAALGLCAPALATEQSGLLVGAAKAEVTPSVESLALPYYGILDPLFTRAIVVEDDGKRAVIINFDTGSVSTTLWTNVTERLQSEFGIAPETVMISATHTHSVPRGFADAYVDTIVDNVGAAIDNMQPARIGFGTGVSHLNVNRNIIDKETNRWWEGPNYEGVSDKTVAVVSFETMNGEPLAVYYNYAMHAITAGMQDLISADFPGVASQHIEDYLGTDTIALFSSGAAGDQNPLYVQQAFDLREIRIEDYAARGEDISNAMPPGGEGLNRDDPRTALLLDQQKKVNQAIGTMLAEEVLHVARNIEWWETSADIRGGNTTVSCPGRVRTDSGRAGLPGTYEDGDDVVIPISLIAIGDIYLTGVGAEIYSDIGQRFLRETPYKTTALASLTNGRSSAGYIYSDEASGYHTFEVLSSGVKPGCAEAAIVDGLLELVRASR